MAIKLPYSVHIRGDRTRSGPEFLHISPLVGRPGRLAERRLHGSYPGPRHRDTNVRVNGGRCQLM